MKIKPYPIKTARQDANKNLVPNIADSIAASLNQRIEQASKEGKDWVDLSYTIWDYVCLENLNKIMTLLHDAYATEGYVITLTYKQKGEACYTIQIMCEWGEREE